MTPEELLPLAIPVAFILAWSLEAAVNAAGGGRAFPKVRGWAWVGIGFFLMLAVINASLPLWLDVDWLARHRLVDLSGLGPWAGALVAYVAVSFLNYWFHRFEHRFDVMWRGLHQVHHVAERVDMPGWALGHPLETVVFGAWSTAVMLFVLGVDPLAVALASTVGTIVTMFVHLNVPTPRWIGWVLLRPEQHCLHHERDIHARNYGVDLAIWDQLFGTFENPAIFTGEVGFGRSSMRALGPALAFVDVGSRSPNQ